MINALAALSAGATRLHGTAIGIGERVGNTPMDMLLVNLVLMGYIKRDLSRLVDYCEAVSAATGRSDSRQLSGRRARCVQDRHRRARGGGDQGVSEERPRAGDAVYSGVPASLVGRDQEIEVGPMSGKSNVVFWLEKRGLPVTDALVERIFAKAKSATAVLDEKAILDIVNQPASS